MRRRRKRYPVKPGMGERTCLAGAMCLSRIVNCAGNILVAGSPSCRLDKQVAERAKCLRPKAHTRPSARRAEASSIRLRRSALAGGQDWRLRVQLTLVPRRGLISCCRVAELSPLSGFSGQSSPHFSPTAPAGGPRCERSLRDSQKFVALPASRLPIKSRPAVELVIVYRKYPFCQLGRAIPVLPAAHDEH